MRTHRIQLVRPSGNWSPAFERLTSGRTRANNVGRKNTSFMSHFHMLKRKPIETTNVFACRAQGYWP